MHGFGITPPSHRRVGSSVRTLVRRFGLFARNCDIPTNRACTTIRTPGNRFNYCLISSNTGGPFQIGLHTPNFTRLSTVSRVIHNRVLPSIITIVNALSIIFKRVSQ